MTDFRTRSHVAAIFCLGIAGCNSSTDASTVFLDTPLVSDVASNGGQFEVDLFTAPEQPPTFGTVAVQLRIANWATKVPCDGLTVTTTPVMPSMGHGTSEVPTAEGKGNGLYVFPAVNLFMSGRWALVTDMTGASSDTVTLSIDVK